MSLIKKQEMDKVLNIRVLRLASKMSLIFQRETLRPAGIKVQQWRILVSLAQFGELHLRALARHSTQDPAHTSRVVKSMIKEGWVVAREDGKDFRRIQFELTESGRGLVRKYWPRAKAFAADVGALFTDEEFQQFKEMLERVNASCDARMNLGSHDSGSGKS